MLLAIVSDAWLDERVGVDAFVRAHGPTGRPLMTEVPRVARQMVGGAPCMLTTGATYGIRAVEGDDAIATVVGAGLDASAPGVCPVGGDVWMPFAEARRDGTVPDPGHVPTSWTREER